MSRTNGDSKKMDIVVNFMSWEKENERGIKVNSSNNENEIFTDIIDFPVSDSTLLENGNLIDQKYNTTIVSIKEIKNKKDFDEYKKESEKRIKSSVRLDSKNKSKDSTERVG